MPRINVDNVEPDVKPEIKKEVLRSGEVATNEELRQKSSSSMLSAFCAFPKDVRFSGEHDDEDIILLLRAHWVTNVFWLLVTLFLAVLPIVILPVSVLSGILPTFSPGFGLVVVLLWYAGVFSYAFLHALYWYFNVGIVTNERVVDIDWNSLVHHDVAITLMSQVQDVRAERIGVLTAAFDYGHVHVQTAGTDPNIEFFDVPHPQLVVRKLQELMATEEKEHEVNPQ